MYPITTKPIPGNWKLLQLDPVRVPLRLNAKGQKKFQPHFLLTIRLEANQDYDIATVRAPSAQEKKAIADAIAASIRRQRVTQGMRLADVECGEWYLLLRMTEMSRDTSTMAYAEFQMTIEAYVMRGPGDHEFMNNQV